MAVFYPEPKGTVMNIELIDAEKINEFDLIRVQHDLEQRGVLYATVRPGNRCIWVTYGNISCYYFVRDGKILDVIYD